ncbi:integrase [Dysgonomonadaceae bacterium PH5-43]|nr:integrase [Dysgonomonadaceae bacterium PH5-43]
MASVKIKIRHSVVEDKEGVLYYQITHSRVVRQIKTGYKLFPDEWDCDLSKIVLPVLDENPKRYLLLIHERLQSDKNRLSKIINALDQKGIFYTVDDIVKGYYSQSSEVSLCNFMEDIILKLKKLDKIRTSETYTAALNSFMRFRNNEDVMLNEIDSDLMEAYEAYLTKQNIGMNTISFYMRILRAVYNRAVEKGFAFLRYPFKQVYTGTPKTIKRAISLETLKQIKELDLNFNPKLEYVRDMFMFSFYTRGMSFIDMAYLRKSDLQNGMLSYKRKKTGQKLYIKWENCMQEIVDKYQITTSLYLLPIIKHSNIDERRQYKNAIFLINRKLKEVAKKVDLSLPLTMYVARHSWASIAQSKNIPISVISEGMGHDSETTTQIYLASLDTAVIDNANSLILKCF